MLTIQVKISWSKMVETMYIGVITTVEAGRSPAEVAVDPTTHKVYVENQYDNTASVIARFK